MKPITKIALTSFLCFTSLSLTTYADEVADQQKTAVPSASVEIAPNTPATNVAAPETKSEAQSLNVADETKKKEEAEKALKLEKESAKEAVAPKAESTEIAKPAEIAKPVEAAKQVDTPHVTQIEKIEKGENRSAVEERVMSRQQAVEAGIHHVRNHRERFAVQQQVVTPSTPSNVVTPSTDTPRHERAIVIEKERSSPVIRKQSSSFSHEMHRISQQAKSSSNEREFRERQIRDRDYELRENNLRSREIYLQDREKRIHMSERDLRAREDYYRRLRAREWQDVASRDRELRYLLLREREMQRYYWEEDDLICHYVTRFKRVARVNRQVTVCQWRNGVRRCFHPTRYYIVPVRRVVCE